ncbi:phosphotransferase-like protein [Ophiostoma piceae UAMH 11346]|uniref:Phosphotransferase-like protein n=1 Tax=Ophiostoma piceae (strain UAMH 11346) TaxID=1262450 RepID=S3CK28_OPHP1|nr:phosphotransferase-like protein [Ophiostoma piceae UAMH 11346]
MDQGQHESEIPSSPPPENWKEYLAQLKRERDQAKEKAAQSEQRAQEAEAREKQERHDKEQAEAREKQERHDKEQAEAREKQERHDKEHALRKQKEAEDLLAPTDYPLYLRLCHDKLFGSLTIQEDSNLTSAGGVSKADKKRYPLHLQKWEDFPARHKTCQARLVEVFKDGKHFKPAYAADMVLDLFADGPVADEDDMKKFQFFAVEAGVRHIVQKYLTLCGKHDSSLPTRIRFLNNPYGLLSLASEEETDLDPDKTPAYRPSMAKAMFDDARARGRGADDDGPPPAKRQSSPRPKLYPDQWCFRVNPGDVNVPIFVIEYKAAHKLSVAVLEMALNDSEAPEGDGHDEGLFFRVIRALQGDLVSLDDDARGPEKARESTALVLSQAFDYMVEFGLCYSYVTSGKAIVLLHLRPDDPRTLYYHLAVPGSDVGSLDESNGNDMDKLQYTANALVTTLVLLALDAPPLTQSWKQKTNTLLKTWPIPYDDEIMEGVRNDKGKNTDQSQRKHPQLVPPVSKGPNDDPNKQHRRRRDNDDDDVTGAYKPSASSRNATKTLATNRTQRSSNSVSTSSSGAGGQKRDWMPVVCQAKPLPYCTQTCLLGLRTGGPLDSNCPNAQLHNASWSKEYGSRNGHPLTARWFVEAVREQLARDLDNDCEGLDKYGKFGATSMLFRIVLQPYGYSFVAKGVQRPHLRLLKHEQSIYGAPGVAAQQGRLVPVCLGLVELVWEYISYTGAHITHMLLLSYCGEPLWKRGETARADLGQLTQKAWAELRQLGVLHGDERDANVVWNAEQQRVMCIDFGEAELVARRRPWSTGGRDEGHKRPRTVSRA